MSNERDEPNLPNNIDQQNQQENLPTQSTTFSSARLLVGTFAIAGLSLIFGALYKGYPLLDKLSDTNFARGVITFVVSLATISIAFALMISVLMDGNTRPQEAFSRGKEIFTILVGIFGTCLGFYFSSTTPTPILEIATPSIIVTEKNVLFTTFAKGGKPPYTYSIVFDQGTLQNVIKTSETGLIQETIPLNTTISTAKIGYTLKVADSQLVTKDFVPSDKEKIEIKAPTATATPATTPTPTPR